MGRVQTGMASFCKPPPTAEQREQQHLEEGQKFKQRVQKQRADNQQRAAEAAKHKRKPGTHGRLRHAQHSQQGQNEAAGEQAPGPQAEEDEERRGPGAIGGTQLSSFPSLRRRGVTQRGVRRGAMRRGMGKKMVMILELLRKTRRQN